MKCEIISFKTRDSLELFGGLQENKKSDTVIIHVHGMTDHFFEGNVMTVMSEVAKNLGFGFFSFNNRGAELLTLMNNDFYGTSHEKFEESIFDLDAAIHEMRSPRSGKKRKYKKIILSGHSTGCQKIAYYLGKASKSAVIQAAIFLAPADDINFQKKLLGNKKFNESVQHAKEMIRKGQGKFPVPEKYGSPMFSARRYHDLYSGKSAEGHIFNYAKSLEGEENLQHIAKIQIPFLAVFGSDEQYAAIPPEKMLKKIAAVAQNPKSKTAIIPKADHSFHGQEFTLRKVVRKFLTTV